LRHAPDPIGPTRDTHRWADVTALRAATRFSLTCFSLSPLFR